MFKPDISLFEEAQQGGAGDGTPPVFDPVAYRAEVEASLGKIMVEVNKSLNGFSKKMPVEVAKAIAAANKEQSDEAARVAAEAAANGGGAHPPAEGGAPKIDPAVNAEMQRTSKELKELRARLEASDKEKAELAAASVEDKRVNAIRTGIWELPLKDDSAKQLFFDAYVNKIKRDEDGNLIGESESGPLPFKDYLKGQAEALYPYLLSPKGGGGGGAGTKVKNNGGGFDAQQAAIAISSGKMNAAEMNALTPEQRTAMWNELAAGSKT